MGAPMECQGAILVGQGRHAAAAPLALANRHGLIAGATGTGKTVTLQVLAEGFSARGVPVFLADVKGDLAGIARPATPNPKLEERAATLGLTDYAYARLSRPCSGTCSASRAIRSAPRSPRWARCCSRGCSVSTRPRRACSTSPSGSPTTRACCCSTSKDLRAMLNFVAEHAQRADAQVRQCRHGHRRRDPAPPADARAAGRRALLRRAGARDQRSDAHRPDGPRHHQRARRRPADASPKLYATFLLWLLVGAVRGCCPRSATRRSPSSCSSSTRPTCCSTTRPRRCSTRSSRWCG